MEVLPFARSCDASQLVDVMQVNERIKVDLIYATNRNFTGKVIYKQPKCYLLKEVAEQLNQVQKKLEKEGYGLLIWDAYRPLPAQQRLWDVCPDSRYVSPPSKGGKHTRGTTVDLTMVDLKTGKMVEMPTGFDDFSFKAASNYEGAPEQAKKNRALLQRVMIAHGFSTIKNEWWHFDYKDWNSYPVLEVDFELLS